MLPETLTTSRFHTAVRYFLLCFCSRLNQVFTMALPRFGFLLLTWFLMQTWLLMQTMPLLATCSAAPPNIVVFLSDDHTITDSSLYGSNEIDTPNMERLAATGMTFDGAFVASPSCAPSRAALLTGLMPSRNGAEANHSRPHAEIKKLPAYLQELGYQVVSFGKVGHYAQTPNYGFDIAKHFKYHEDVAVGEACEWLRQRKSRKPLCLFVGTNWPHVPWPEAKTYAPDDVDIPSKHVDTPETRNARANYLEAVRTMDRELGDVMDVTREMLGEETLFIHTSDHGAQWPFGKWTLYDAGIRTPLIVSWPGKVRPGSRTDALVSWVDLLPTIVEAAGGTTPPTLDGKSIMPVLDGSMSTHREAIFTVHSGDGKFNVYPMRSIRTTKFKYIRNLHPEFKFNSHVTLVQRDTPYWPSWVEKAKEDEHAAQIIGMYQSRPAEELYDLEADPGEHRNLAMEPKYASKLEAMRGDLQAWMEAQGDTQTVFGEPELLDSQE